MGGHIEICNLQSALGAVAQWLEQLPYKQRVAGPIPASPTVSSELTSTRREEAPVYLILYQKRGQIVQWLASSYDEAAHYLHHLRGSPIMLKLEVYEVVS